MVGDVGAEHRTLAGGAHHLGGTVAGRRAPGGEPLVGDLLAEQGDAAADVAVERLDANVLQGALELDVLVCAKSGQKQGEQADEREGEPPAQRAQRTAQPPPHGYASAAAAGRSLRSR